MTSPDDDYARVAGLYDPLTAPFLAGLRRALTAQARKRGVRTAVDLCCGTGAQLIRLDRAGIRGTGVDLSLPMLQVARSKSPPSVAYLRADAAHAPLPAGRFDLAVLAFALHEKPPETRKPILGEAFRLVRPGGTVAVADYLTADGPAARLGHLGVTVFERAAGREHHANYLDFLERGGLLGLAADMGLAPERVLPSHLGAVGLALFTTQDGPQP